MKYGIVCSPINLARISSNKVLTSAEERSEEYFLPDKRFEHAEKHKGGRGAYDNSRFQRQEDGSVICPEGKPMRLRGVETFDDGQTVSHYEGTGCEGCPARDRCTKGERRTVSIDSRQRFREAMREKLRSDRGRETYMKRQGIAEPLHGDDQKNRGWRQHHLRGLSKTSLEFVLIRIATNLGKIVRYRAAVTLSDLEGFKNREIADILEISLDTLKIRLHRARARLKKELERGCHFYHTEDSDLACAPDQKIPKPE